MSSGFDQMNEAEASSECKAGGVVVSCQPAEEKAWVELKLVDDRNKPVANEPYWIKLPDDQIRKGNLDHNGFVRIEGIEQGVCLVKFLNIDAGDWQLPAQESPAAKPDDKQEWIEIELLDENEQPVADEPFWIKLPDGNVQEGTLDENGYARLEGVESGTCVVKFPNIDENEIEKE